MTTVDMFEPPPLDDASDTDSYCSPPEIMECIHAGINGVSVEDWRLQCPIGPQRRPRLDPWTNSRAIAHGWVNAEVAWTLADGHLHGHHPDRETDPEPWPLMQGDYVHANPPYSGPAPYIERFCYELRLAKAWGGILVKTDNRTSWWAELERCRPFLVMFQGPVNFFHKGARVKGNNFASTLVIVDYTGTSGRQRQHDLERAFADVAWVHR